MSKTPSDDPLPPIGWREWVALPDLGVSRIKVKVDTGARTSALHAFDCEFSKRRGKEYVRFQVHPAQRDSRRSITAEAEVIDRRHVRNSGGTQTLRPVIETRLEVMGESYPIELTLVSRDEMGFRMLLGRQAVRQRFLVDAGRSYLGGKPPKKRTKKKKKSKKRRDTAKQRAGQAKRRRVAGERNETTKAARRAARTDREGASER